MVTALAVTAAATGEQLLDLGAGQRLAAVRARPAALQHSRQVGGDPPLLHPPGGGRPDGIEVDEMAEGNVTDGRGQATDRSRGRTLSEVMGHYL
jgi:hypothetical protein